MLKTTSPMMCTALCLGISSIGLAGGGGWVSYNEETDARLSVDANLGANDTQEKDYFVGDVDNDGDDDLVIVRKEPFTSSGRDINLLLLNENGVLVDRTSAYASSSDVSGDQGFLTPTNDRDVELADLDGDGWLDIITATTLTDNDSKHLSHPRVYMNLGEDNGVWQGFRHEDARIPQMHATAGPRFCSVAAGDIDGDGDLDLYFGDYDSGTSQIYDYNNKLLINNGNGYFTDESDDRLSFEMRESAFGAASVIADMNGDGVNDITKQTSLNPPQHVAITYNDRGANEGWFVGYEIHNELAPYFVEVGDLNGDGMLDMVVTDDGVDSYYLNTGNGSDGYANFDYRTFDSATNGFGGDSYIHDLNNDGNLDVIITDVDVDIPGCSRTTHIFRNRGDFPDVTFSIEDTGIGGGDRTGVHDVAIIDINGDGWKDLIFGRCSGTVVWMNQPPTGIVFSYPDGLPGFLVPGEATTLRFRLDLVGDGEIQTGSGRMFLQIDNGSSTELPLEDLGDDTYRATLPPGECTQQYGYWFEASMEGGGSYTDPPAAGSSPYVSLVANGSTVIQREEFEAEPDPAWTVVNDSLETGAWERVDPNGTIYGNDTPQPEDDATAGSDALMCYITQNGTDPESPGEADVDGGPTQLLSPIFSLEGIDGTIAYSRWMYDSNGVDLLQTHVSNDGGSSWTFVHSTNGTDQAWETASFIVSDFVEPTDQIQIRYSIQDGSDPSLVEGGIDNVSLEVLDCATPCSGDLDGSGDVTVDDLLAVLAAYGTSDPDADLDDNGTVDVNDVLIVIAAWGDC